MLSRKPASSSHTHKDGPNPLATFAQLLREQLHICDQLEKITDDLPDKFNKKKCADLAQSIPVVLSLGHLVQDCVVFPALLQQPANHQFARQTADRLYDEHLTDQWDAFEVCDLLQELFYNRSTVDMGQAGYLLRSFFESIRQTVSFELEYLLPLARNLLSENDLNQISEILRDHKLIVTQSYSGRHVIISNQRLH
jgi:hypothetical protein